MIDLIPVAHAHEASLAIAEHSLIHFIEFGAIIAVIAGITFYVRKTIFK
tara:strand:- start:90 stop:236 length:147 start_codon:yes stop_codon:yes gene_type:complete